MDQDRDKNWRELCKAAANELDPAKLMALVVELNEALDERYKKHDYPVRNGNERSQTSSFQSECTN